jgi:hypothetical protein
MRHWLSPRSEARRLLLAPVTPLYLTTPNIEFTRRPRRKTLNSTGVRRWLTGCNAEFGCQLVAYHGKAIRDSDATGPEKRISHSNGPFVVLADFRFAAAPVLVHDGDGQAQVVHVHHDHCLEQVTEDGVCKNRSSGLDLKAAPPFWVVAIDLVPQGRLATLAIENRSAEFARRGFALLNLEPELLQVVAEGTENLVTF